MGSQRVRHTLVAKQQHHHINSGNNHQGTVDQNHNEVSPHTCQIAYQKHKSKQVSMKMCASKERDLHLSVSCPMLEGRVL